MSRILALQGMRIAGQPAGDNLADSTYSSAAVFDSTVSCCCCGCDQSCNTT